MAQSQRLEEGRIRPVAASCSDIRSNSREVGVSATDLLTWYDRNARTLPWRAPPGAGRTPAYRVWLSEIMLQQTTVTTVKPYFERFLELWPTVQDLAAAPREDVLAEWAGLGYYARARNLHKCAGVVAEEMGGRFPETKEALLALPGIGPYTAGAIAAITFDQPEAAVDGNVERVMSRRYRIETPLPDAKKEIAARTGAMIPSSQTVSSRFEASAICCRWNKS